jgi:2-polyprenyl-3-methyl-5-hydroxy-6-metoxy-1,4-benzoquinol methylase
MENVRCNFCGTDNRSRKVLQSDGFRYVRCRKCGFIYQDPRPSFSHLKNIVYTDKYFNYELRNQDNFFALMKLNLGDFGFDGITARMPARKRFLDIGSATGLLLNHVRSRGWVPVGVELCGKSAEYTKKHFGIHVHNTTLEQVHFPGGYFDAIHMSHIIEHVPDPLFTLKEVRRILKPGGILLIITPNIASLQAFLFGKKWRSAHKDHLQLFSTRTLRMFLENAGLSVKKQFSYGGIGVGLAPAFIKKPVDKIAKALNFGDVTAFMCVKSSNR